MASRQFTTVDMYLSTPVTTPGIEVEAPNKNTLVRCDQVKMWLISVWYAVDRNLIFWVLIHISLSKRHSNVTLNLNRHDAPVSRH